jgi:hypothetical protein
MATVQAMLGALEQGDTRAIDRRARGVRVVTRAVVVVEYLIFLGLGLFNLWRVWRTAKWDDFWIFAPFLAVFMFLPFLVLWTPRRARSASSEKPREGLRGLREVAATSDEQMAPG